MKATEINDALQWKLETSQRRTTVLLLLITVWVNYADSSAGELYRVTSFGDPLIETIDGAKFDFNGYGEYIFLNTSNITIQVRLEYVIPGKVDATLFTAFSILDKPTSDYFEVHLERHNKDIQVYKNSELICNANRGPGSRPSPCERPERDHCLVLAGGGKVVVMGCAIREFARTITFTAGELMSVSIDVIQHSSTLNVTGLAGHQEDGKFVCRNGTKVSSNSSASVLYDYGQSWALTSQIESNFNYSLTDGNYTFYNGNKPRPRFLEDLMGNLTELFNGYSPANISLFNSTCRHYWDNKTDTRCLMVIARTGDIKLGKAQMEIVNKTRRIWELLHNHPPNVSDNFPENITVQYNDNCTWTIDLKDYIHDDFTSKKDLRFAVQTKLPKSEYTFYDGVFTWIIGTGLRYIDTDISFTAYDSLNASAHFGIAINYCGCEEPGQCYFDRSNSNSTDNVNKASCNCPEYASGLYCEAIIDNCPSMKCYKECNATAYRALPSWPCAPCPNGRHEVMSPTLQTCEDINECASDYNGKDKCQQTCSNTDGSFFCACMMGYTLNANNYSCDDIDECTSATPCPDKMTEVCFNTEGSYECTCAPGYSRDSANGPCRKTGTLEESIDVKCIGSNWNININMDMLKRLYPDIRPYDIFLGEPTCHGIQNGSLMKFNFDTSSCQTTEMTSGTTHIFSNKLFYVIFDSVIPFLIRHHIWTFAVECDFIRSGTGTSHLHHGIEVHHATYVKHYNVTVELFSDNNFQHPINEDIGTVRVGEDVYVKVTTTIPDWNTKMRLHTCYTRPNNNATSDMDVVLIRNGCEVDGNTHIISQSTHETRFVFQDFEYLTNDEGLDVICNATFCDSKDYSPDCVQTCHQSPSLIG